MLVKAQDIDGHPELCIAAWCKRKRTGQHADHRVCAVVQIDRLSHNVASPAEAMEPCPIAQDYNIRPAQPIFAGIEIAAKHGIHTEGLEEAAAHALALYRFRARGSAQKE